MTEDVLAQLAHVLALRNDLDRQIAALINRPMTAGHLGEYIACKVFAIDLESSASAAAIDGRFTQGSLAGKTVNVKWYPKREGMLDLTSSELLDYYLVLAGPARYSYQLTWAGPALGHHARLPLRHSRGAGRSVRERPSRRGGLECAQGCVVSS